MNDKYSSTARQFLNDYEQYCTAISNTPPQYRTNAINPLIESFGRYRLNNARARRLIQDSGMILIKE